MRKHWLAALLLLVPVGCVATDDGERFDGPGNRPWNEESVTCTTDEECGADEACENGVCQMRRCAGDYESLAPLGQNHYFGTDGEIAVVSDQSFIDSFEATSGGYIDSLELEGEQVIDVAGGNLTGERPQGIVVALAGSSRVLVAQSGSVRELDVGVVPAAIATGDVDADSLDELVAFGADGSIALCEVETSSCQHATIDGAAGRDAAVADVDGDGFAEPIFLFDLGGQSEIIIWNPNAETTGQEASYGWQFNVAPRAMAAGDLDGDRVAEVVLLEDGGWWGWADDRVHLFSVTQEDFLGSQDVDGETHDVAVGDRNSDDVAEVAILRQDHMLEVFTSPSPGTLSSTLVAPITVGDSADRLAMLDWDGDSASGKLVSGPELVTGSAVPTMVVMFPPYDASLSDGVSSLWVGNSMDSSESTSDTVSLSLGVMVGFGLETPIFEAKVSASLERSISVTKTVSRSMSIGQRWSVEPNPEMLGFDYAGVVMSCGCYHRYRYETEDPADRIGGSGQIVEIFIPVGGQTLMWSSKRYNAAAAALGTMPPIDVPLRIGEPGSYPATPTTLSGEPIPQEDLVFPDVPAYPVSDVAATSFWLSASESETNEVAESIEMGVSGSIGALGAEVEVSAGVGFSTGYAITVGSEATFSGDIPAIFDDPATPEDEYSVNRYNFTPHVYRHHYLDQQGEDAGYYVLTFSVSR
jgi:hypothetical protein